MVVEGTHQCRQNQGKRVGCVHGDADHLSRKEIDDGGDVHDLALEIEVCEICCPNVIRIQRTHGHEQIRVHHSDILGPFPPSAPSAVRLDAEEIHHALHSFAVKPKMNRQTTGTIAGMFP